MSFADVSRRSGAAVNEYTDTSYQKTIISASNKYGGAIQGIGSSEPSTEILFPTTALNAAFASTGQATFFGITQSAVQDSVGDNSGFLLKSGGLAEHYPYIDGNIYSGAFANARWVNGATPPSPITAPHSIAYTAKNGEQKAYYNGSSLASGSVAVAPSMSSGRFASGAAGSVYGWFFFAAFWDRILSPSEIAALDSNPWVLFKKSPRILYFPSAGGGGATITGDSGSYTLTGTAATLKAGRKLAADSGTYNLTGTAAALKVGRKLTADSGTYTLTGTAVAFKRGYALGAESGTYTVSGTSVNLKAGRKLTADSGSYALTGTDVTLNYSPAGSYNLTAESGTYTLTGTAATLKVSRKLTADSGTYALTGTAAGLAKGVRLTAESGSYTLTGSNVAFARTYVLTAESGAYTLTGTSAGLTWSGAPVVEVPTNGGPSIYGKPVFREKQFRKEYEEQVKRIEDEKRLARILREDEEITVIMALMAA